MSILDRSTPEPNTGCYLWEGAMGKGGYGNAVIDGRHVNAHRQSWEENKGAIPDGLFVLHRCDLRLCVNPEHLFLGTPADNMDDMTRKGRRGNMRLSNADVEAIRQHPRSYGSQLVLAKRFGISVTHVAKIRSGAAR